MRADIKITIQDTTALNGLPSVTFTKSRVLSLDLPVSTNEFIESMETVITENLVKSVTPLARAVADDVERYTLQVEAEGKCQLVLQLEPPPQADLGAAVLLDAPDTGPGPGTVADAEFEGGPAE